MKEIFKYLKNFSILKSINLRGNKISKEGISLGLDFLDINKNILAMDLSENPGFNKPIAK